MSSLGFIPARSNSKGLPKKNIKLLAGKPLIAYSIEEALKSNLDRVIVSTDSEEIASIAVSYGAEVPFLRPSPLGSDNATIESALEDCLSRLKKNEGYEPVSIMLLQPTSPLRTSDHINKALEMLNLENETILSVSEPMEHPAEMVYFEDGCMKFLFSDTTPGVQQRQQYRQYYFTNGAIYAFKAADFIQTNSRYTQSPKMMLMKQIESIDIDTEDDFLIAEAILKNRPSF